ncbi:MAG TPA: DUF3419 family protein [Chloroflexia bacterium]|jgi:S-adenosylmethionine-diacylglycerol 3-amino-3-carboxypropyl transferase
MTIRATSGSASLSRSNGGSIQDRKAAEIWRQGLLGKNSRKKESRGKAEPEVVFAQVHEDTSVELTALTLCPEPAVAFCISSGGCTAFSLLTARPEKLVALDINPAQTYLLELKRAAFAQLPYGQMLIAMQRDALPVYRKLRQAISPQARAFWDRRTPLLALGLCRCGLIERKGAHVMRLFRLLVHNGKTIIAMLSQPGLRAQQRFYHTHWDTWRWRLGLRLALSKPALRQAYGPDFVAAVPTGFSDIMHERMARVFTQFPILENSSLWQAFLGIYPPSQQGLPPYLQRKHFEEIRARLPEACLVTGDASDWIANQPARSIGFFALSNILEVTSPVYAQHLWRALEHAAKPGAIVCLRSIFPLGPDQLPPEAASHIDVELSGELQRRDNSPFAACIYALRM